MVDAYIVYDIFLPDCLGQEHPDKLCEEASGDWGSGANVTLSDDSTVYKTRTASLKAVSTGADDVYYYPSGKDLAADMTGAECICFWYRSTVTNSFRVSIHTNGSNYKYKDITPAATNTWYFAIIKLSDMSSSGTLNHAYVDYIQFDHKDSNRTLYLNLVAVGKLYEIDNITEIDIGREVNADTLPALFREGNILIALGTNSRRYMMTFQVTDEVSTEQQLLDEINIIETYFPRKEALIFHSEASNLKRDTLRGKAIYPLSVESSQTQGIITYYLVTMSFVEYDNPDLD